MIQNNFFFEKKMYNPTTNNFSSNFNPLKYFHKKDLQEPEYIDDPEMVSLIELVGSLKEGNDFLNKTHTGTCNLFKEIQLSLERIENLSKMPDNKISSQEEKIESLPKNSDNEIVIQEKTESSLETSDNEIVIQEEKTESSLETPDNEIAIQE